MARIFDFAIRRADLPRLDALRLDMGSDFWPEAGFAVFHSAMIASVKAKKIVHLPAPICQRAAHLIQQRGCIHFSPDGILVRHYRPDPDVVMFLRDLAKHYGLKRAKFAATALISAWAADPDCWPGAPMIGDTP